MLGLRKSEIEAGANCMSDRNVETMIIRNVTVDYVLRNREEFEGWFWQTGDHVFVNYWRHMWKEGRQGDDLILKTAALGLQVDIQVFF